MTSPAWQLEFPVDAVIFDCDGTLSCIEGIDELAKYNHVTEEVSALTALAMGTTGIDPTLYEDRLNLVKPTREQLQQLGQNYFDAEVPDAAAAIKIFQQLGKTVYIVSAGLLPAVRIFGHHLRISPDNIYAVDIYFDAQGNYLDFERTSPLIKNDGKKLIVADLIAKHKTALYVGDGLNDLAVLNLVTRFVGYGGVFFRENIKSQCQFYLENASMLELLPLALTAEEIKKIY